MTEKQFIDTNISDWVSLEDSLKEIHRDPEKLHTLFIKVSSDLSFAQTYYPRRKIRWYLNGLINQVFDIMRVKPKINLYQSLSTFYTYDLPSIIIRYKKSFITSFVLFAIAFLIGAYSTKVNSNFPITILGERYENSNLP